MISEKIVNTNQDFWLDCGNDMIGQIVSLHHFGSQKQTMKLCKFHCGEPLPLRTFIVKKNENYEFEIPVTIRGYNRLRFISEFQDQPCEIKIRYKI